MGKKSIKENKNIYQESRDKLGLTREAASEKLDGMSVDRIAKIEAGKMPYPEDIVAMSKGYKMPELCNYYCAHECPIGRTYVPEIKIKDLSQIVLEMLAALNSMNKNQERLIEIANDGVIDNKEIEDFVHIQEELEKISITVETLQLWVEKKLANGAIDKEIYEEHKKNSTYL